MSAAKKNEAKGAGKSGATKPPSYRLPTSGGWASAWQLSAVLAGLGLIGSAIGWNSDPHRFAFSWLFGFMTFLAIGLGALFYVLALHLTGGGWGVVTRRTAEFFMAGLPVFVVLFIPIAVQMDELYPWMAEWREAQHQGNEEQGEQHGEEHSLLGLVPVAHAQEHGEGEHGGEHDAAGEHGGHGDHHSPQHALHERVIEAKLPYLDYYFFLGRALVYLLAWAGLAYFFFTSSTGQDTKPDLTVTKRSETWAPLATIVFALSLTFAAIDWMMSLEPAWFSTIYGVQYFSVSAVASLAAIIVTMHLLRDSGLTGTAIKVDHFHDVGKLLFGFNVFWAYISFSQFMLIWYASIPEETTYYHLRFEGGWWPYTWMMWIVHFVIPFFFLISRNIKRRVPLLAVGAAWMLVAHAIEVYWLVMPNVEPGSLSVHWVDFAALFAVGGVYLTVVFFLMTRFSLIPTGDPRLARSLHLEVA